MDTEEKWQARRRARIERIGRRRRRRELFQKWGLAFIVALAVVGGVGLGFGAAALSHRDNRETEYDGESAESSADGLEIADNGSEEETSQEEADKEEALKETESSVEQSAQNEEAQQKHRKSSNALGESLAVGGKIFTLKAEEPAVEEPILTPEPVVTPAPLGESASAQPQVFELDADTEGFDENILSKYGIFIDVEDGTVLAQKEAYERMNPASMTKILTVLVAAEHLTVDDLEETAKITIDITDYSYVNDCSNTGYELDEVVTVRDLFYGTILPSGADSALALAIYVAGSHEAFVDMMNEKLAELGLAESSHFTNCVGLYDKEHYTTAYDMAIILKAATDNTFCRDVMSAHTYTTSETEQHPEGLLVSNWFLRRIEDRDTHGEVLCAKTGYVDQSGSCAASLGIDSQGREYLCVTAGSNSSWTCIADQVELYQRFLPAQEGEEEEGEETP